jgi:hypothetical protein
MFVLLILAALVVLAIVATVFTETEKFGLATVTLIAALVGAQAFHIMDVLHYAEHHVLQTLLYAVAYVGVGVLWSFVKWFSFLMSFRDQFRELKGQFLTKQGLDPNGQVPEEFASQFKDWMIQKSVYGISFQMRNLERPKASDNKSRILAWMSLWPFSVVGTVLNDPIRRLFNFLFNQFKALYQKMADRVLAKDTELK